MQPIVISEVTVSFDDYQRLHNQVLGWRRWLIRLISIVVLLAVLWFTSLQQLPSPLWRLGIAGVVVGAMLMLSHFSLRRSLRKVYHGNPAFAQPITYTLDDAVIRLSSPTGQSALQWAAIRRVQVLPGWWLLRTANSTTLFLAASRIQPPATAADVTALLQRRGLLPSSV